MGYGPTLIIARHHFVESTCWIWPQIRRYWIALHQYSQHLLFSFLDGHLNGVTGTNQWETTSKHGFWVAHEKCHGTTKTYGSNQHISRLSTRISHLPRWLCKYHSIPETFPFAPPACKMLEPHKIAGLVHQQWQTADVSCNIVMPATPKSVRPTMRRRSKVGLRKPLPPWFDSLETSRNTGWEMACISKLLCPCYPYFYVRFARGHIDAEFTPSNPLSAGGLDVFMPFYAQDYKSGRVDGVIMVYGFGFTTVIHSAKTM